MKYLYKFTIHNNNILASSKDTSIHYLRWICWHDNHSLLYSRIMLRIDQNLRLLGVVQLYDGQEERKWCHTSHWTSWKRALGIVRRNQRISTYEEVTCHCSHVWCHSITQLQRLRWCHLQYQCPISSLRRSWSMRANATGRVWGLGDVERKLRLQHSKDSKDSIDGRRGGPQDDALLQKQAYFKESRWLLLYSLL